MLHVSNVSKSYGAETVLSGVSFIINDGERAALAGPNGSGKTTLLRIVMGLERPDEGKVRFDPASLSVGYLAQSLVFAPEETVGGALARACAEHAQAQADMEGLAMAMSEVVGGEALESLTAAYADAEARFQAAGGYELEALQEEVLAGLGLADVPRELRVERLSGGQKTRLGLAHLLLRRPRLLLLDEPTNHLDLEALGWLEGWLRGFDGAALVVSHDRDFLDAATNRTLALDPDTRALTDFPGSYSAYAEWRQRQIELQWQAYADQQQEIARLWEAAHRLRGLAKMRHGGKADDGDKFAKGYFRDVSIHAVARAKHIERRIERLTTDDKVEKPTGHWSLKLDLARDDGGAREVLRLEEVSMAFPGRPLFAGVSLILRHGERVAFIGPNGAGKTTLLRIVTGEVEPTSGRAALGPGVRLGYLAQGQEILDPASTPYDTIRAEGGMDETAARRFLHQFLFGGDDVFTPVGNLSFGERARLMLALLVARGCNFLLLDEPVNHLDIESRERFEEALLEFPGTLLAVVHDRAFIRRVATSVWELREGRVRVTTDGHG